MKRAVAGAVLGLLLSAAFSNAQQQAAESASDLPTRLQQAESTYLYNLRRIHAPILQDYQRKLENLHQQLQVQGRAEHASRVAQELQRVRQLLSTTGILPYDLSKPAANELEASLLAKPPGNDDPNTRFTLSLHAADAISPVAVNDEARKALPLGSIAWNVTSLPAGQYEVMMVFAASLLPQDEPLMLTLGSQQVIAHLPAERATGSDEAFRVFRLGSFYLPAAVSNQTVTLQNGNPAVPRLRVRNVLFVRAADGTRD